MRVLRTAVNKLVHKTGEGGRDVSPRGRQDCEAVIFAKRMLFDPGEGARSYSP